VDRSVQTLSAGKDRLDAAAKKLAELDTILAETDRRLEEARKVREWLARAETRLEEINRQAEEQLKLLSTLLKEEGSDKRGKGAPPGTVQETVRKLARQGWATEEIARAVKISRGEVELILELGGKN
jgi:response regulator of citrate/malate metabolism